mmetsp:Transcript_121261/g.258810  ORF Transcript_121261/g.258810 Transcript_121261/m.258810 type:complete len:262 (+) Transcript_121261:1053-1838(+)
MPASSSSLLSSLMFRVSPCLFAGGTFMTISAGMAGTFSEPTKEVPSLPTRPATLVLASFKGPSAFIRFVMSPRAALGFARFVTSPSAGFVLSAGGLGNCCSCRSGACAASGKNSFALAESVAVGEAGDSAGQLASKKAGGGCRPGGASVGWQRSSRQSGACCKEDSAHGHTWPATGAVPICGHSHGKTTLSASTALLPNEPTMSGHACSEERGNFVRNSAEGATPFPEFSGTARFMSMSRPSMTCGSARHRSAAAIESRVT